MLHNLFIKISGQYSVYTALNGLKQYSEHNRSGMTVHYENHAISTYLILKNMVKVLCLWNGSVVLFLCCFVIFTHSEVSVISCF